MKPESKKSTSENFFPRMDDQGRLTVSRAEIGFFLEKNGLERIPAKLRLIIDPAQACFLVHTHERFESFVSQLRYFRGQNRDLVDNVLMSSSVCTVDKQRRLSGLGGYVDKGILEPKKLYKVVCSFDEEIPSFGYPLRVYPVEKTGDNPSVVRVIDLRPRMQRVFPDLFSADALEAG